MRTDGFSAGRTAEITGLTKDEVIGLEAAGVFVPARNARGERIYTRDEVRAILRHTGREVRRRIATVNQKGGVGKTTTAFNLAGAFAQEGRRVLCVDLDAQANLTRSLGLPTEEFPFTSHDLLLREEVAAEAVVVATPLPGIDLIPADIRLASADILLREVIMRERVLSVKLESLASRYDVLLLDCPPNLSTITINALLAADTAVVPLETQVYSVKAVDDLAKTFHLLSSRLSHHLDVFMLPTKIDLRVKLCREFLASMEQNFAGRLLTPIPTDANLMKAPMVKEPAVFAFPSSRGAAAYRRVARELLAPPAPAPSSERNETFIPGNEVQA